MAGKRVLFIDDDYLVREAICELLTDMGCEVKTEKSGEEAVRMFAQHPEGFDLVLTDLMMLGMTGDKLAERIHSIRPDTPVVVMTATPGSLSRSRAETAGIRRVLAKPLTKAELREGLRGIL